ncbi:hypothetical protein, partial [uncultured Thiodictyon sp.]|uniref:hypothetical protein n=1 Tax=uncultured Thiodictyon sp. TaxID=1846217 RepID=UPI0025E62B79
LFDYDNDNDNDSVPAISVATSVLIAPGPARCAPTEEPGHPSACFLMLNPLRAPPCCERS